MLAGVLGGAAIVVGMYLRTTQRKNSDGTVVRYVQLAHNRRMEGVTQAEVLVNLGREDGLDPEGLRGWSPRSTVTSAKPTQGGAGGCRGAG